MSTVHSNSLLRTATRLTLMILLALLLGSAPSAAGKDKKDKDKNAKQPAPAVQKQRRSIMDGLDLSKIVWPNPPAITRIKYLNYWSGEKFVPPQQNVQATKKLSWMERVSGITTGETPTQQKPRWQLITPNGVAVDSKGRAFVADSKVRAIFIVDVENDSYDMIKNGVHARFQWLSAVAIDDADYLFAADTGLKHVLVFDPQHKVDGRIAEGMVSPAGLAIDNENRLLYVADSEQDLVLVYDADPPYKLIRKLGKPGTNHTSTANGEFAKPTAMAVDEDGNVYVADTWNDRVQVFDADGAFIRAFGKAGDGPGYFARPKGIAIDSDGHVWVADAIQDRVQVFTPEGRLLIYLGGHGLYPGQFQSLSNLAIDKNNRVFTTEIMPGRMQIFRYLTNAEARAEKDRRDAEAKKKKEEGRPARTAMENQARPESSAMSSTSPAAQKEAVVKKQ